MLKFITALLFAQVLLAAPMPQQEEYTENNESIGNSNVQFISAAAIAPQVQLQTGVTNSHIPGSNSAPDPAPFSVNTQNIGAPPKLDSPKPQPKTKMGSSETGQ